MARQRRTPEQYRNALEMAAAAVAKRLTVYQYVSFCHAFQRKDAFLEDLAAGTLMARTQQRILVEDVFGIVRQEIATVFERSPHAIPRRDVRVVLDAIWHSVQTEAAWQVEPDFQAAS